MPDLQVFNQFGTGMKKTNDARTVRYRNEKAVIFSGTGRWVMPVPPQVFSASMHSLLSYNLSL
jgi:hypothetical protein